jgi:predicted ArsR family transcriptional regulator
MSEVLRIEEKTKGRLKHKPKPRIRSFRKYQVLLLIANGICTSREISKMLKLSIKTTTSRLTSYRNNGYIAVDEKQYTGLKGRPTNIYKLTQRGAERLSYFDSFG